jgi:hypothetical protein
MAVKLTDVGRNLDLASRLPDLRVPTLVINRREDQVNPLATSSVSPS